MKHCVSVYLLTILFAIKELEAKNHFKGRVLNDPFKIRRLVDFKINLCKEIINLKDVHGNILLRYAQ